MFDKLQGVLQNSSDSPRASARGAGLLHRELLLLHRALVGLELPLDSEAQ